MKFIPLLLITLVLVTVSCNKDKFTTIPQVEIASISPETVFPGDVITIKGSYTDQEGDIDSIFVVRKYFAGATASQIDTLERFEFAALNVPAKTTKADLKIEYEFGTNNYPDVRPLNGVTKDTTAAFGVILKDKAGNRSEYKESKQIRLKKN